MRMIFEVDSLDQASPATISRCGVVFVQSQDLQYCQYIKRWVRGMGNKLTENNRKNLMDLFRNTIDQGVALLEKNKQHCQIQVNTIQIIQNMFNIIESISLEAFSIQYFRNDEKKFNKYINYIYAFAYIWSLGALLSDNREDLDALVREIF